jgi:hypothetical protein
MSIPCRKIITKYANDAQIVLADCDRVDHKETCDATMKISGYSTLFIRLARRLQPIHPKRDIEHFIGLI